MSCAKRWLRQCKLIRRCRTSDWRSWAGGPPFRRFWRGGIIGNAGSYNDAEQASGRTGYSSRRCGLAVIVDNDMSYLYDPYRMQSFSTQQAAKKLGITGATLSRYISSGKVPSPKSVTSGGMTIHLWTEQEIEHVRQLLPKIANGRKTRYKKHPAIGSKQSRQARDRSAKAKGKSKTKKKT